MSATKPPTPQGISALLRGESDITEQRRILDTIHQRTVASCPFCGGTGKRWHYTYDCESAFESRCSTCRGTGVLSISGESESR